MADTLKKSGMQTVFSRIRENFRLKKFLEMPQLGTCILALAECICMLPLNIRIRHLAVAALSLFLLARLSPRRLFPLLFLINGILMLVDMHLLRIYQETFRTMGEQLLNVMLFSIPEEYVAYFRVISPCEYALLLLLIALSGACFFYRREREERKSWKRHLFLWTVLSLGIVFGYPANIVQFAARLSFFDAKEKALRVRKEQFRWHAVSEKNAPHTVIFLVGESHRAKEFIPSWDRLPALQNTLSFRNMISQYGYTLKALPMLLSRKKREDSSVFFHESSMFKLFEEAGYETHFIHYLSKLLNGENSLNFITEDVMFYHRYGTPEDKCDDKGILPLLDRILKKDPERKKFIVIKMIGVHYNFEDRYPDSWDVLKPSLKTQMYPYTKENREVFLNTYRNAINYSIDVIRKIFLTVDRQEKSSLLFFISDHGMNIFDDGVWNRSSTRTTYHIPFMIHANAPYLRNGGEAVMKRLGKYADTPLISAYVFETLVSAAFIRREEYDPNYDLLSAVPPDTDHIKREVVFSDNSVHDYDKLSQ